MDVFTVVADPTRRRILDLLADGEAPAGRLVAEFPELTQPAVSRHLKVLREADLVEVRTEAQRRLYRVRPDGLAEIDAWIARYRRFWTPRLDALDAHIRSRTKQGRAER